MKNLNMLKQYYSSLSPKGKILFAVVSAAIIGVILEVSS